MIAKQKPSVHERMRDQERIQKAMREAVQDAIRRHKLLGEPIVVWEDGKVVVVPPEKIVVPTTDK
jgi:hypothetical protein